MSLLLLPRDFIRPILPSGSFPDPSDDEIENDNDKMFFQQEALKSDQEDTLSDEEETPLNKCTGHLFSPVFYSKIFQGIDRLDFGS